MIFVISTTLINKNKIGRLINSGWPHTGVLLMCVARWNFDVIIKFSSDEILLKG